MNGIFANYLWTMFWGSVFWIFWIMWFFPRKCKYRCIRVYVWFKDDKHVIWMWIWMILKNISLLDRIWSLWVVRFAHSPPDFIFWLRRLIFSVSINSHPDNLYISACSTEYEVCDSFASLTRHQTSYSGSAGWYFRYQSIHIQITYTYTPSYYNNLYMYFDIYSDDVLLETCY